MVIVNFNSDQMTNVYQLLYSRNSTQRVKLNISFVIFKCISRHLRGIKIKIFRDRRACSPIQCRSNGGHLTNGNINIHVITMC